MKTMPSFQMISLFVLNSIFVIFVAGQTELLDQDVEIISGKNIQQVADPSNPLDAQFAGQFAGQYGGQYGGQLAQNIYAPPVSLVYREGKFILSLVV